MYAQHYSSWRTCFKVKCGRYWPTMVEQLYGDVTVQLLDECDEVHWMRRTFQLTKVDFIISSLVYVFNPGNRPMQTCCEPQKKAHCSPFGRRCVCISHHSFLIGTAQCSKRDICYDNACPSVCHTCESCLNGSRFRNMLAPHHRTRSVFSGGRIAQS